jgi:hypothetical protein
MWIPRIGIQSLDKTLDRLAILEASNDYLAASPDHLHGLHHRSS